MAPSALSSLPLLLVTAGLALLAASLRLTCLARRHRNCMEKLLQLANGKLEPLELPAAAWPLLAQAGWQHLAWEGVWFGQNIAGTQGNAPNPSPTALCFEAGSDETRLHLRFSHTALRGEKRLFADQLAHVFVLMLETRLRARSEALAAALAQRARLSLYLQHDMRNMAQWVGWVAADFSASTDPESLLDAAQRLRDNAALAQDRAERLITALAQIPSSADTPEAVDLRQAIQQAAQLAGFQAEIKGEAQAWMGKTLLAHLLDTLFASLAPAWRASIQIQPVFQLHSAEKAEIDFYCPWPNESPPLTPEKLFEPFADGRPGGLGFGLYQARKSVSDAGGELSAQPSPGGLSFQLRLPKPAP